MTIERTRRLGRGLEALIAAAASGAAAEPTANEPGNVAVARVRPNPFQPRRDFPASEMTELEASMRSSGLLQPITVRRAANGGDWYELIAGERRLRAASALGWSDIPAIVRNVDDRTALTLALVENLQRADLNAIDEASGYRRLSDDFGFTQQEIADAVGKDRTTVTNLMRLLTLPQVVLTMVAQGRLSASHGRALLPLTAESDFVEIARETISKQLSVRDVEARVRQAMSGARRSHKVRSVVPGQPSAATTSPVTRQIEDRLRRRLQTDVHVTLTGQERGTISVSFYSSDDLDRLLDLVLGPGREDL